jgi:hypothetical protein
VQLRRDHHFKIPSFVGFAHAQRTLCCSSFCVQTVPDLAAGCLRGPTSGLVFTQEVHGQRWLSSTLSADSGAKIGGRVCNAVRQYRCQSGGDHLAGAAAVFHYALPEPWNVSTWLIRPLTALPSGSIHNHIHHEAIVP